jgi:hypothetical protein
MRLTEEQHRDVEAAQGKPVDVVDPQTQQAYVLLPAELYQRVRDLVEREGMRAAPGAPPASEPPRIPLPPEGQPMRVKVRALPTPPEVAEEVKKSCRRVGFWRRKYVQQVEDELKLQYYFGGQAVSYLYTREGLVVVAAGDRNSDAYDRLLSFLPPEERRQAILDFPFRWHDTTNEVITPFPYES